MHHHHQTPLIDAAVNQIRDILMQLEESTGLLVDEISVKSTETTNLASPQREALRQVEITLCEPITKRWA